MKPRYYYIVLSLLLFAESIFSQTNQTERLFIPFLDKESQSNVIVTVCDLPNGQPCPIEYTNVLSNTNLFASEEQKLIGEAFVKYKNVTTNSGPLGTIFTGLYKTNIPIPYLHRTNEIWLSRFVYTNSSAYEDIMVGQELSVRFRTESNDGYNVFFADVGGETLFGFTELKKGLINGLLARFRDIHAQGQAWNYRLSNFTNAPLMEYRQYTNGMILGKYLMWNSRNNNLMLEAEFKEPYDFEKHRIDLNLNSTRQP